MKSLALFQRPILLADESNHPEPFTSSPLSVAARTAQNAASPPARHPNLDVAYHPQLRFGRQDRRTELRTGDEDVIVIWACTRWTKTPLGRENLTADEL